MQMKCWVTNNAAVPALAQCWPCRVQCVLLVLMCQTKEVIYNLLGLAQAITIVSWADVQCIVPPPPSSRAHDRLLCKRAKPKHII